MIGALFFMIVTSSGHYARIEFSSRLSLGIPLLVLAKHGQIKDLNSANLPTSCLCGQPQNFGGGMDPFFFSWSRT
jgi:hypothetical protein